jgi:hypothetical protein
MKCLLKKAVVRNQSQLRREDLWATVGKALWIDLPKPFGSQILPLHATNGRCRATGVNV